MTAPETAQRKQLVVIGDAFLDVDVLGRAARQCPDSQGPVIDDVVEVRRPGGAGLAAALAAEQSRCEVTLLSAVPDDDTGEELSALLAACGVRLARLTAHGTTRVKRRIRVDGHTVARIDTGDSEPVEVSQASVRRALDDAAAVLVSDYGGGLTRLDGVRAALHRAAAERPVVWDPHPRGAPPVDGVLVATPNLSEAASAAQAGPRPPSVADLGAALLRQWASRHVLITLGEQGALLHPAGGEPIAIEAHPADGDPCGAGDALAAHLALQLAGGVPVLAATQAAVRGAAEFVDAGGASHWRPPSRRAIARAPVVALGPRTARHELIALGERLRRQGRTVVATGGCFDLLHAGHVTTLEAARAQGDVLVVLLNSDDSVRALKGAGRPVVPARDRARVLSSMEAVDAVVVFPETTPVAALQALRPHVWVKGGDYTEEDLPEAALVRTWGGRTVVTPFLDGHSTTSLVSTVRSVAS